MIDWVRGPRAEAGWPPETVHFEHFSAPQPGVPFDVELAVSGKTIHVGEQQSLLEAIEAAGVDPPYLCRGGVCGQCETNVISCDGTFLHNDHWLTEEEHALGQEDHALRVALRGPLAGSGTVRSDLRWASISATRRSATTSPSGTRRSTSGAFPFPFHEDSYMYAVNIEPHVPGPKGSVLENLIDVDEHYVSEMRDRALVLAEDPLRCQSLPHMTLAGWDLLELLMERAGEGLSRAFRADPRRRPAGTGSTGRSASTTNSSSAT